MRSEAISVQPRQRESVWQPYQLLVVLCVLLATIAVGYLRSLEVTMRRPFDTDESTTIVNHTWIGVKPSGERFEPAHISDFYSLPRPTIRQVLMGVYCAAGRWIEPNNHVVNSLLTNFSLAGLRRDERSARLPSLIGAIVLCIGLFWLCYFELNWHWSAPLICLWAWLCPYMIVYSQSTRGYSWMLALEVLLIIQVCRFARRPSSLLRNSLCVACAVLLIVNIVSTSVDVVFPVYLALVLAPPETMGGALVRGEGASAANYRRAILCQVLVIGSIGATFLLAHLPYVFSSANGYGEPFEAFADVIGILHRYATLLMPGPAWQVFVLLGIMGVTVLCADKKNRFVGLLCALTILVSAVHFLGAKRFAYARVAGFLLPLIMLGAAYVVEWSIARFNSFRTRCVVFTLWFGVSLVLVSPWRSTGDLFPEVWIPSCDELGIQGDTGESKSASFITSRYIDPIYTWYYPAERPVPFVMTPGMNLELYVRCEQQSNGKWGVGLAPIVARDFVWNPLSWVGRSTDAPSEGARWVHAPGVVTKIDSVEARGPGLVYWYPGLESVSVDRAPVLDHVKGIHNCLIVGRFQMKMDIHNRLAGLVLIADSDEEMTSIKARIQEGLERFGGSAAVFVPSSVDGIEIKR